MPYGQYGQQNYIQNYLQGQRSPGQTGFIPGDIDKRKAQSQQWITEYGLGQGEYDQGIVDAIIGGQGEWQPKLYQYFGRLAREKKEGANKPFDMKELGTYLQGILSGGLPGKDQLRQQAYGQIDRSVGQATQRGKENLASSGLFRSGVGQAGLASILGSGSQAKGAFESDLIGKELDYKNQAVSQLLGLGSQYQTGVGMDRNFSLALQQLLEQQRQFNVQQDNQADPWMQLVGQIVGTAGGVAVAASDRRLKRNIKLIGQENGYNIYSFNYFWDDIKHKGVMSDEVPKEAIIKIGGYDFVNYSKIGVNFA
jgi:hypothetical protein